MDLIKLSYESASGLGVTIHPIIIILAITAPIAWLLIKWKYLDHRYSEFEINEVEIGVGSNKIKIKPNDQDLQIAYQLWVELSTRKIGLKIDKDHDVVTELYNSWYDFFKIARELMKSIPVKKVRSNNSTKEIIDLSFKILNDALRPHLTMWQARFRKWYELESKKEKNISLTPQEVQKAFPEYKELEGDILRVNNILISYKEVLEKLINIK